MGAEGVDRQQQKVTEFLRLLPLTIEIAGLPNSDRHGMETAHYWEDEEPEAPKPEDERQI